jgi:hypothetical protein
MPGHEPSMNFFGHAALAAEHFAQHLSTRDPRKLALPCSGAMLPDFVGMLRLSRPVVLDATLAGGVSFHHLTDHAFHELTSFHQLSRHAFAWLSASGIARGPARAIAHIGVEILLDEVLARDAFARECYLAALATPLDSALEFPVPDDGARLAALRGALLERASSETPPPELVAQRIRRTLAGRPRLAVDAGAEAPLSAWVVLTRPLIAHAAPALLTALRAELANSARPE